MRGDASSASGRPPAIRSMWSGRRKPSDCTTGISPLAVCSLIVTIGLSVAWPSYSRCSGLVRVCRAFAEKPPHAIVPTISRIAIGDR